VEAVRVDLPLVAVGPHRLVEKCAEVVDAATLREKGDELTHHTPDAVTRQE
jgi:hypothetical protein